MKNASWSIAASLLLATALFAQQSPPPGDAPALAAVAGEAMLRSQVNPTLEQLADDIGGRVTGSPQCNAAIQWAVARMKAIGLTNVHAEPWMLDHGWRRVSASAELLTPAHHPLNVASMGWVGSTPAGGVDADVVPVNVFDLTGEIKNHAADWRGKVLLMRAVGEPPKGAPSFFFKLGEFLRAAHQAGAVAVIGGQGTRPSAGMDLTHTGVLGFNTVFAIPVVNMAAEDQLQIERFLDRGKSVRLHIDVQNEIFGSVPSANVVGDIPGREWPDQVVVIGGHLDSWDLSAGATDDGTGAVAALGAARAIVASGQRPRRTVRVVLFTGEEQGLLGSLAYVQRHRAEMSNHIAALILDEGQGPISAMQVGGHDAVMDELKPLVAALQGFGPLDVDDHSSFGTDAGPFILAGLPGINLGQDSPNYKYTHHSAVDTFDHVRGDILIRNAAELGVMAFWIADRAQRLDQPWTPAQVAAELKAQHLENELRAFGLWTFGE